MENNVLDFSKIRVRGASEHNLKNIDIDIERGLVTVITGVSGSGKSSLAFDTILAECQRRFFHTLSQYTRQFLDISSRPNVRSISGLSPAIALAQRETQPSLRATVGTLSDISEMLGIIFANHGEKTCPKHGLPTTPASLADIVKHIKQSAKGRTIALTVNVAHEKKGVFKSQLTKFRDKKFTKAYIDGSVVSLEKIPNLEREEKHIIKVIVDQIKIKDQPSERLTRSIEICLKEGGGYGEWYFCEDEALEIKTQHVFSTAEGCPTCGLSWPKLDTRFFNANSLGRCETCEGYGVIAEFDEDEEAVTAVENCALCWGTGIKPDVAAIRFDNKSLHDFALAPISEIKKWFIKIENTQPSYVRVRDQILVKLNGIESIGLDYLNLSRRVRTLSGGEQQRLKLAGILAENLCGVLYVLDEPSQGLHPTEISLLWENINRLKSAGNTLVIVDHDEELMRRADWIIDLGPGGGSEGGQILAKFRPDQALDFKNISSTAASLSEVRPSLRKTLSKTSSFIKIIKPTLHNLKMKQVEFPLGSTSLVTGISGAGKSSLVLQVLFDNVVEFFKQGVKTQFKNCEKITGIETFENCSLIDRRPIAKSSISTPATYLDLMSEIKELYASLPESKIAGLTARSFSTNAEGGRCPECKGKGEIQLHMRFLADARVRCSSCHGQRFRPLILDVKFQGLSINDIFNLTLAQTAECFKYHRKISHRLSPALSLGLGYLKTGQPSSSLSGGESQRLKLVPFFQKKFSAKHLVIIDEPTVGLHSSDIEKLKLSLKLLTDNGATLIIVDNNVDLLEISDWHVHIGPQSANLGGELVYQGLPENKYLDVNLPGF